LVYCVSWYFWGLFLFYVGSTSAVPGKTIPETTYYVSRGTLSICSLTHFHLIHITPLPFLRPFSRWTYISRFPSIFFLKLLQKRSFGDKWHRFFAGQMPFSLSTGSDAFWKVLKSPGIFSLKYWGLGKSWKIILVLENHEHYVMQCWKVLEWWSVSYLMMPHSARGVSCSSSILDCCWSITNRVFFSLILNVPEKVWCPKKVGGIFGD